MLRTVLFIALFLSQGSLAWAQGIGLPLLDTRSGDTIWLAQESIVELWTDVQLLAGKVIDQDDSTLTVLLDEHPGDTLLGTTVTVLKRELRSISVWKDHGQGVPFDGTRFTQRRALMEGVVGAAALAGGVIVIVGELKVGVVVLVAAAVMHIASNIAFNARFKTYRFRRKWALL